VSFKRNLGSINEKIIWVSTKIAFDALTENLSEYVIRSTYKQKFVDLFVTGFSLCEQTCSDSTKEKTVCSDGRDMWNILMACISIHAISCRTHTLRAQSVVTLRNPMKQKLPVQQLWLTWPTGTYFNSTHKNSSSVFGECFWRMQAEFLWRTKCFVVPENWKVSSRRT